MSQQQPWPEGVDVRYLTVGGATVDLRFTTHDNHLGEPVKGARAECLGCLTHYGPDLADTTRRQAQAHAETCRALPRPEVQA